MRRFTVNVSAEREAARALRETFMDRPVDREKPVNWKWPTRLHDVGIVHGVMYTSDKWKKKGAYEDYKHRAEGPQQLLVRPDFIVDYDTRRRLELPYIPTDLNRPLPATIAELAPILGIQAEFYKEDFTPSGECFQIDIRRATLGAAKHPKTGETFLIVYTPSQLCAVIVGQELDVTADGIVG